MNKFCRNLLALCASCALFSLSANEDPAHLNERLEAAKADAKRFKSALLRAQKNNREQVDRLSNELKTANIRVEKLQNEIKKLQQESLATTQHLRKDLDQAQLKSEQLKNDLHQARQNSEKQIAELMANISVSHAETAQLKDELIKARKGSSDQIDSLEQDLRAAHQRLQRQRNELAEAKTVNSKQLKNFTAWLYTAKNEAQELKKQLDHSQENLSSELTHLQQALDFTIAERDQIKLELAEAKKEHEEELLIAKEQLFIAAAQSEHMQNQMQQEREHYQQCCVKEIPPIVCWRPNVEEPTSWVRGEILVWTAEAGDLDFVIPSSPVLNNNRGQIGDVEEAKFGWDPGFRVEIGHRFRPDFWELALTYTYINIDGSDSFSAPSDPNRFMVATKNNVSNQALQTARSQVDLFYNVFDLMLARSFLPTKQMIVRPSMGLTGTWMDREFDVKYNGAGNPANLTHNRDKWEFHGGGMRVGVDIDWYLGKGFSIYGKSSIAALLGFYKNTYESDTNNATTGNPPATIQNARYDDQRIATNIQVQLGPAWGKMWGDIGVLLFAGYEVNAWFNVEEVRYGLPTNTNSTITPRQTVINDSSLGLQGFVGKLQVNF